MGGGANTHIVFNPGPLLLASLFLCSGLGVVFLTTALSQADVIQSASPLENQPHFMQSCYEHKALQTKISTMLHPPQEQNGGG